MLTINILQPHFPQRHCYYFHVLNIYHLMSNHHTFILTNETVILAPLLASKALFKWPILFTSTVSHIALIYSTAARCVLAHDSLMVLSRELSEKDVRKLALQLGVSQDLIDKIKDQVEGDVVRTNFRTLCEWRGKTGRATMVDFLVSSLRTCGRMDCANVISHVRGMHRGLAKEDFNKR